MSEKILQTTDLDDLINSTIAQLEKGANVLFDHESRENIRNAICEAYLKIDRQISDHHEDEI